MSSQFNVVTFAHYLADGRLVLQVRGYRSPEGRPVSNAGLLSINGGNMESADRTRELLREIEEELGLVFAAEDLGSRIRHIGDVLDATTGRICHVHRLAEAYEQLLNTLPTHKAVQILLNPEGLGRVAVWREDLDILIEQGKLTRISVAILEALPELLPSARPAGGVRARCPGR